MDAKDLMFILLFVDSLAQLGFVRGMNISSSSVNVFLFNFKDLFLFPWMS